MTSLFGTIVGLSVLLAAAGCSDKTPHKGSDPSDGSKAKPSTQSAGAATAAPSAKTKSAQRGSLLLIREGRGMLVADSTLEEDCQALQPGLVGETFATGGAEFRFTGVGPSRDPALPATEAIPDVVLLYERVGGPKDVVPDVAIFPTRDRADAKKEINWVAWESDSVRPDKRLKAAFRHAVRSKRRLKHVEFSQRIEVNVTGTSAPDLLIVASAAYPECERDPDACMDRDTAWLVLVPDGKTSSSVVVWTGQDEASLSIWNTYDLDGDGVHAFSLSIGDNPNESAIQFAARIRDGKLSTKCGH